MKIKRYSQFVNESITYSNLLPNKEQVINYTQSLADDLNVDEIDSDGFDIMSIGSNEEGKLTTFNGKNDFLGWAVYMNINLDDTEIIESNITFELKHMLKNINVDYEYVNVYYQYQIDRILNIKTLIIYIVTDDSYNRLKDIKFITPLIKI